MLLPQKIEIEIIFQRKCRLDLTSSLCITVNLLYEVYVFVKHSELSIVLKR